MGWDTQINIIAENCDARNCLKIAKLIYTKDAKDYFHYGYSKISIKQIENESILFFTYERRKYLPYWIVQEISATYPFVFFSVIASCPDFIGAPAGLVRILNDLIIDSYGFFGTRQLITKNPNEEILLSWFGRNKGEELIRNNYIKTQPMAWCEENFIDNLVEFTDTELEQLTVLNKNTTYLEKNWTEVRIAELENSS